MMSKLIETTTTITKQKTTPKKMKEMGQWVGLSEQKPIFGKTNHLHGCLFSCFNNCCSLSCKIIWLKQRLHLYLLFLFIYFYFEAAESDSLGQWSLKHDPVSLESPLQGAPSWAGVGLLQERVRLLVPLPQVSLQGDHAPQSDHIPSTEVHVKIDF